MELQQFDLQDFLSNCSKFEDSMRVTNTYKFGDDIWDFSVNNNERRNSIGSSKLKFNWGDMEKAIGKDFVYELKVVTYLVLFVPDLFKRNAIRHKSYKVNTVHAIIKKMLKVIEEILIFQQKEMGIQSLALVSCLGELTLKDFEKIPMYQTRISEVKQFLKYIANPLVQSYLIQPVQWSISDIKTLNLFQLEKDDVKEISATPIEEKLYVELIKQVTVDLISFKKALKLSVYSKVTPNMLEEIEQKQYYFNVSSAFEDYVYIREKEKACALKSGKRYNNTKVQRSQFVKQYRISVQSFYKEMMNIQRAATMAILLFTGVRYSELISFKKGCIQKRHDVHVLKGTVIKKKSELLPTDIDEWVAIPIVRDAVEILEQFQRFTFNSYIVSPLRSVYLNQKDVPISLNAVSDALNMYVTISAEKNQALQKYVNQAEHKITIHRIRHTIAQQLIRGRLGLPYISYHLKHINSAIVAYNRVNNVTLGYGGISKEILNSAKQYQIAKKELIEEIYHPNSVIAGGRNANEFTKRKKEYFQGLMLDDSEIEEFIENLKSQSLPFLDVGLGYCGGRKDIVLQDGTKQPPSCIGQLKCNPVDCGNAVIPKSKLPIWKKVYQDTLNKLQDEEFRYMEVELKETLKRAEYVMNHFHAK